MKKNQDTKQNNVDINDLSILSLGEKIDDEGVFHENPSDRYMMGQGVNVEESRIDRKLFFMELIAMICLALAIISTGSAFFKGGAGQYVQKPDGLIKEVRTFSEESGK